METRDGNTVQDSRSVGEEGRGHTRNHVRMNVSDRALRSQLGSPRMHTPSRTNAGAHRFLCRALPVRLHAWLLIACRADMKCHPILRKVQDECSAVTNRARLRSRVLGFIFWMHFRLQVCTGVQRMYLAFALHQAAANPLSRWHTVLKHGVRQRSNCSDTRKGHMFACQLFMHVNSD